MAYAVYFTMMAEMVADTYWPPRGGGAQFRPEEQF